MEHFVSAHTETEWLFIAKLWDVFLGGMCFPEGGRFKWWKGLFGKQFRFLFCFVFRKLVCKLSAENACFLCFGAFFWVKIIPSLSSIMLSFIKRQKQIASLIDASLAKCFLVKFTSVWRGQCKACASLSQLTHGLWEAHGRELQA